MLKSTNNCIDCECKLPSGSSKQRLRCDACGLAKKREQSRTRNKQRRIAVAKGVEVMEPVEGVLQVEAMLNAAKSRPRAHSSKCATCGKLHRQASDTRESKGHIVCDDDVCAKLALSTAQAKARPYALTIQSLLYSLT